MGLLYTGISCLLTTSVSGYSRVPVPPAKMMPFMGSPPLEVVHPLGVEELVPRAPAFGREVPRDARPTRAPDPFGQCAVLEQVHYGARNFVRAIGIHEQAVHAV